MGIPDQFKTLLGPEQIWGHMGLGHPVIHAKLSKPQSVTEVLGTREVGTLPKNSLLLQGPPPCGSEGA